MPVSNYSPELIKLWELGATEKGFKFNCKTNSKAHSFRWRLHSLRRAMREENHPSLEKAEQALLTIWPDTKTGTYVWGHLPDAGLLSDVNELLREAGMTEEDIAQFRREELARQAEIEKEPNTNAEAETTEEALRKEESEEREQQSTQPEPRPDSVKTAPPLPKATFSENAIDNYLKKGR